MNMSKSKEPRGKARKASVLDHLKPDEAAFVLRQLLASHPDLAAEAAKMAKSLLHEESFENIADEVEEAVNAPDLEELNSRAGRHSGGYTDPTDAAWEILEEAVAPFIDDITRHIQSGLAEDALEICKGVVLGLYRVENGGKGEVVGWAPDFAADAACNAIDAWRAGGIAKLQKGRSEQRRKRHLFPRDFVDGFVPEWREMIARHQSRSSHA
jgi:hypothetical protein